LISRKATPSGRQQGSELRLQGDYNLAAMGFDPYRRIRRRRRTRRGDILFLTFAVVLVVAALTWAFLGR